MARTALEICHFDPDSGEDRGGNAREADRCEAACYDCLMHYANQPVHRRLDRKQIKEMLHANRRAQTQRLRVGRPNGASSILRRLAGPTWSDGGCVSRRPEPAAADPRPALR